MPGQASVTERFWELDALRGLGVLLMICSNFALDLQQLGLTGIDYSSGFWKWSGRLIAGLFVMISGVSLSLKAEQTGGPGSTPFRLYLHRGLRIFACGLAVTAATRIIAPDHFVHFGVLHLIGAGTVLAYPFLRLRHLNLVFGAALMVAGFALFENVRTGTPWLLWLGLRPEGYRSLDYTPFVPWFGLILFGLFLGRAAFPAGQRRFPVPSLADNIAARSLVCAGKRSLLIYLAHQPVLLAGILLYLAISR